MIPRQVYDNTIKFLLNNKYDFRYKHEKMYGLYAYTKSKKLLTEFMDIRGGSGVYNVIKSDMSEEMFYDLNDKNSELKLIRSSFKTLNGESMELVVTKNEDHVVKNDSEEYIYEFGISAFKKLNYIIFNEKIIKALDRLNYVKLFERDYGDTDLLFFNDSFGLTPEGHLDKPIYSELNTLLYLFRYMFVGSDILQVGDKS